jgi:DNA-binding NtrC family response regulator
LRERRDDILPLVEHFLCNSSSDCERVDIEPEALQYLLDYDWPGNVRQLEHTIKRMVVLGQCRKISVELIPPEIQRDQNNIESLEMDNLNFAQIIADYESNLLKEALRRAKGNKSQAAKILQMKPSTFRDHMAKYRL